MQTNKNSVFCLIQFKLSLLYFLFIFEKSNIQGHTLVGVFDSGIIKLEIEEEVMMIPFEFMSLLNIQASPFSINLKA